MNKVKWFNWGGNDPMLAIACPICQDERGIDKKYVGFDLFDHLKFKHSKIALADFLSSEACQQGFWDK